MKKFRGVLQESIPCDTRSDDKYLEANTKVNLALIRLQQGGAKILKVEILAFDKGYAVFTITYEGDVDLVDSEENENEEDLAILTGKDAVEEPNPDPEDNKPDPKAEKAK